MGGGEAFAVGLVAGDAVAFLDVDFVTGEEALFAFGAELLRDWGSGVFIDFCFGKSGEATGSCSCRIFVPSVLGLCCGEGDDLPSGRIVHPGGRDDGFEADPAVGIFGSCGEQLHVIGKEMGGVAQDADCGSAHVEVL